MIIENLLWIILAHYVLDYPLQSDYLAKTKGIYNYNLLAHSVIYGLGMALVFKFIGVFTITKALILVISHFIIDYKKSHAKDKSKALTTYLYIDQSAHLLINIILMII